MDYLPSMGSQLDTTEVTKHIQYFSYTFFRATTGGEGDEYLIQDYSERATTTT